jgi:hypothetical protein
MAKRMTDSEKWKKGFFRGLEPKYKLFWLYILDDCNHAGIWEADFEIASVRLNSKINKDDVCRVFAHKIKVFDNGNKWFIPSFIKFQYGVLNDNSPTHRSVIKIIDDYDVYNISDTNITNIEPDAKPIIKRFIQPSIEEVKEYCNDRGSNVDSDKFFNFYESNGWKVGKNKMKDWRACVRTWEANTPKDKTGRKQLDNKDYNKF